MNYLMQSIQTKESCLSDAFQIMWWYYLAVQKPLPILKKVSPFSKKNGGDSPEH